MSNALDFGIALAFGVAIIAFGCWGLTKLNKFSRVILGMGVVQMTLLTSILVTASVTKHEYHPMFYVVWSLTGIAAFSVLYAMGRFGLWIYPLFAPARQRSSR